jgi:hypothetical protein
LQPYLDHWATALQNFLQFDVIADLSRTVEDSTARLDQMSHQEISETFLWMGAITRRFLAAVNYRGNPALPLFPRYPQSSSSFASTGRSHVAPSSSSRPPFQAAFYPARPPAHPRMSPLGGLLSKVLRLHVHPHQEGQDRQHEDPHLHRFLPRPSALLCSQVLTTTL